MIEKAIKDAEYWNAQLEADIATSDDQDLQRYRETLRRRREEEEQSRQREKEAARERRRRDDEARRRRMEEILDHEDQAERREEEERATQEALCLRQRSAAARIQARVRGRRSRAGAHVASPAVVAVTHTIPWAPMPKDAALE